RGFGAASGPGGAGQGYLSCRDLLGVACECHPSGARGGNILLAPRAEKTEVLSEDLLQVEKRLELVKQVSHSTHKKLAACLQGQQGLDADKRSKKLPLTTLAQCLMEGSAVLGDDSLLGKMLRLCGEAEDKLAQELIHFELQVERDVIEPLFVLAEVSCGSPGCPLCWLR
uniref:Rho GTPase activating protein 44 n=1 Tax=Serinus canaria TaxID=9135 RepID=A0A8C9MKD0_SERCA